MVRASNPKPPRRRPKKKVALAAQQAAPPSEEAEPVAEPAAAAETMEAEPATEPVAEPAAVEAEPVAETAAAATEPAAMETEPVAEPAAAVPVIPQAPWGGEFSVGDRIEVRDMDGPPGIFQGTIDYRINVEGHDTYQVTLDSGKVWPCVCEHQIRARTEPGPR